MPSSIFLTLRVPEEPGEALRRRRLEGRTVCLQPTAQLASKAAA